LGGTSLWRGKRISQVETFSFERSPENQHRRSDDHSVTKLEKACHAFPGEILCFFRNMAQMGFSPEIVVFFYRPQFCSFLLKHNQYSQNQLIGYTNSSPISPHNTWMLTFQDYYCNQCPILVH
jgi:hypothetical protein